MFPRRERVEFVNECNEFTNSGEGSANKGTKALGQEGTKNLRHSERSEESPCKVSKEVSKNVISTDDFTSPLAGEVCFQVEHERNFENRERGKIDKLDCFAFARNDGMFPHRERVEFVNECNEFTNSGDVSVNKVTKLLWQEGTKNLRHSERSEESHNKVSGLVSKNVIVTNDFTSPLAGEVCFPVEHERNLENRERGKINKLDCFAFARNDGMFPRRERARVRGKRLRNDRNLFFPRRGRNVAFTLAEVLITLGIIGVVAAITMPVISANIQKIVIKRKFQKFYSMYNQAVQLTQQNMGYPVGCWYRDSGQLCSEVCAKKNDYGTCTAWTCKDGSPLPKHQNGNFDDCAIFEDVLFNKTLKTVKFCQKDALANGCLIDTYRGADDIQKESNPDKEYDPNLVFSTNMIQNRCSVWILADQTIIIKHGQTGTSWPSLYLVDVNGHRAPNKFGYDMFYFSNTGNDNLGIKKVHSISKHTVEVGGTRSDIMFRDAFSD